MKFSGFALEKRSDTVLLDDFQHGVQSFPIGVERFIPYGRGVLFVYDLQDPAWVVLAAIDVDLNPGVVPADFPAQGRHDDFWIGHYLFSGGYEGRAIKIVAHESLAEKAESCPI